MRRVLRNRQITNRSLNAQLERLEAGQRGVGVLGDVEAGVVVDVVELLGEDGGVSRVVCRAVAALFDFGQVFGGAQEEAEEFGFGEFVADGSGFGDWGAVVVACALFGARGLDISLDISLLFWGLFLFFGRWGFWVNVRLSALGILPT
jgi:hypothetical protein